ncbi:hypothetical protein GCM10022140_45430 [Rhodococcus aetherivorans]
MGAAGKPREGTRFARPVPFHDRAHDAGAACQLIEHRRSQMAKATNATGDLPENLGVTLGEVRRVAMRIDGILQEFDAR